MMRQFFLILVPMFLTASLALGQTDSTDTYELSEDALILLDEVPVNKADMEEYDPTEIAFITIVKGKDLHGPTGGSKETIYVYTKKYARQHYWNYFKSKSPRYVEIVPMPGVENDVAYILNGNVLEENIESLLYDINDSNFGDLKVIGEKELKKKFKVKGKKWGVVLTVKGL